MENKLLKTFGGTSVIQVKLWKWGLLVNQSLIWASFWLSFDQFRICLMYFVRMLWNRMYLVWPSVWDYFAWLQLPSSQEMSLNYSSGPIYCQWGKGNSSSLLRMKCIIMEKFSPVLMTEQAANCSCTVKTWTIDKKSQIIVQMTFTADLKGAAGPLLTFSSLDLVLCLYFWDWFLMTSISFTNYNWEICRMTGIMWYLEHNFWSLLE